MFIVRNFPKLRYMTAPQKTLETTSEGLNKKNLLGGAYFQIIDITSNPS